jgi:hypothetical protein
MDGWMAGRDLEVGMAFPLYHHMMAHDGLAQNNVSDIIMLRYPCLACVHVRVNMLELFMYFIVVS